MSAVPEPVRRVDALARQSQHVDHIAPIWCGLDAGERGTFWVGSRDMAVHAGRRGVVARVGYPTSGDGPVLVASWADAPPHRGFIMVEHGAGQQYQGSPHPDTRPVDCHCGLVSILCPNEWTASHNRLQHPHASAPVVGSAKVEHYAALRRNRTPNTRPVVAFAWHWDSPLCDAARWAFPFWSDAVASLAAMPDRGYDLIGHGHPRAWSALSRFYRSVGIEPVRDLEDVIRIADVIVFDNTSAGWEAAAVGVPVVLLGAPWYPPRDAGWGLRFYDFADAGVEVMDGSVAALDAAIVGTLVADPCAARRVDVSTMVYAGVTGSTTRSVDAVRAVVSV